jgi:ABC-type phosphate/phosphonate transport system permease subunit
MFFSTDGNEVLALGVLEIGDWGAMLYKNVKSVSSKVVNQWRSKVGGDPSSFTFRGVPT